MQNADTNAREWGERGPKGRETFLCLNFSCLAIKYEFYFRMGNKFRSQKNGEEVREMEFKADQGK